MSDLFGSRFGYMAGDFPKAQAVFSAASCPDRRADNQCSGNGDGLIGYKPGGMYSSVYYGGEHNYFWMHLKLADILLNCTCDAGGPDSYTRATTTTPSSAYVNGARWAVGVPNNGQNYINAKTGTNYFELTSGGNYDGALVPGTPTIKPVNAAAIDAKIDDGLPYSGEVLGTNWWGAQDLYGNCGGLYTYTANKYQTAYRQDLNGCNMAFELKKNW